MSALRLAREALQSGGCAPTVLNAANEIAVQAFLDGHIGFTDIARKVERVMEKSNFSLADNLDSVAAADGAARELTLGLI